MNAVEKVLLERCIRFYGETIAPKIVRKQEEGAFECSFILAIKYPCH